MHVSSMLEQLLRRCHSARHLKHCTHGMTFLQVCVAALRRELDQCKAEQAVKVCVWQLLSASPSTAQRMLHIQRAQID
jgi:hypothetical protein